MFKQTREFIDNYIDSIKNKIIVCSDVIHQDKKLEYAFSVNDYMASLSVLTDLTYDFFVVEVNSEKIKLSKTLHFRDIEDLFKQIKVDLDVFLKMK